MDIELAHSIRPYVINHPTVVICGDGRCLPDDLAEIEKWNVPHDVFCCCRSIKVHPGPIDHWADVDAEMSWYWAENLPNKWRNGRQRHTLGDVRGFDFDWEITQARKYEWSMEDIRWYGSTAYFAVCICLEMGYQSLILAGCPLDSDGHWYALPEEKGPRWAGFDYQIWLDFARKSDSYKVKSMSGYTAQILGKATVEHTSN